MWRTELVVVEKTSDDLKVKGKGQSNWEITRTPRNAFRCSVGVSLIKIELLIKYRGFITYQFLTNSECY